MKFKFIKAALVSSFLVVSSFANATLILFTSTGIVTSSNDTNITLGTTVNVGIYAENSGTGLVNQTWNSTQLVDGFVKIGSYSMGNLNSWFNGSPSVFTTDTFGAVVANVQGTNSMQITDSYGYGWVWIRSDWSIGTTRSQWIGTSILAQGNWKANFASGAPIGDIARNPVPEVVKLTV